MSLVCKAQSQQSQQSRRLPPAMNVTNAEKVLKSYCKAKGYEKPVYRITSRGSTLLDGVVYRFKHYVCRVTVSGFSLADGEGLSKRIARKKAAMEALAQLRVLELQDFWEVYQTILPKNGQSGGGGDNQQKKKQMMMVTASAVEIEELAPTPRGVMTPRIRQNSREQQKQQQQQRKEQPETETETADEVELRSRSESRERTLSSDSSNLLLSAAIAKLKSYSNEEDDGGWTRKEEEEEAQETMKKLKEHHHHHHQQVFSEEDAHLFNEHNLLSLDTDLRDIILETAREVEVFEERGQDDFDL